MAIKLSRYTFESLRSDKEFHLCRGRRVESFGGLSRAAAKDRSSAASEGQALSSVDRPGRTKKEPCSDGREDVGPRSEGRGDVGPSSILLLSPAAQQPALLTIKRLEHEYSLRDELDPESAIRPLTLTRHEGRPVLVFEDPGSELLERFLGEPMELGRFLRLAISLTAALDKLHRRGLIHKDIKPAHILVDFETNKVWLTGSESVRVWLANDSRLNLRT